MHLSAYTPATAYAHLGDAFARVQTAAALTNPSPTPAQKLSGDYCKGRVGLHGLAIDIENPRGSVRTGTGPDGTAWSNRMAANYGFFPGTMGNDGDAVDVFIGLFPESDQVWVINQRHVGGPDIGFDEHKVMLGCTSEQQARDAYTDSFDRGWQGLSSIVPCSIPQLKWWLVHGDKTRPFSADQLPFQGNSIMDKVLWDSNAQPVTTTLPKLMYDLRLHDKDDGLMLDAVSMDELLAHPDIEETQVFDALVVQVARMQQKMELLKGVMSSAGQSVSPVEMTISDPVRARGVLQVMVLFLMSDGQTISIWLHNPDTTPAKLTPMDELISWKWMLNKKDVTIVVAPERGKDLNIREVARRVMRLIERNSEAFKKANAKTAERAAQTEAVKGEIVVLERELAGLQRKIEVAQQVKVDAPAPKIAINVGDRVKIEVTRAYQSFPKDKSGQLAPAALRMVATLNAINDASQFMPFVTEVRDADIEIASSNFGDGVKTLRIPRAAVVEVIEKPAAAVGDGSEDAAMSGSGVIPSDLAEMSDDGGYQAILASEKLSLKWQDVLDSMFQTRIIGVRNALRELGWAGKGAELTKTVDGSVHGVKHLTKAVGAGANAVGVTWTVDANAAIVDALKESAAELAKRIDMLVPKAEIAVDQPKPEGVGVGFLTEAQQADLARRTEELADRISKLDDLQVTVLAEALGMKNAQNKMRNDQLDAIFENHPDDIENAITLVEAAADESSPSAIVDAAYQFASATDAFKAYVVDSVEETDYSTFATAKGMDLKAIDLGATIAWDVSNAVLDSVGAEEGEDDFDAEAEFDAVPETDDDGNEVAAVLDGDFKGHPFRGNQHKASSHESDAAVGSSMRAKHAERKGDKKAAARAHTSAHYSHKAASVSATGKAKKYHKTMAKFHGGRAGMVLDAVLDAADDMAGDYATGVISKGGEVAGRAYIGGDGKAMVYVGADGLERVQFFSTFDGRMRNAMWSEDAGPDMVGYLLVKREADPVVTDPAPIAVAADNDASRLNALDRAAPKGAVTSDDPKAIEKLQAKLAALQARQEFMKKANKFFKSKNEAELLAMGLTQDMIDTMKRGDFAGRIGFADYLLTNNNGVISTTRKRMESLMADQMKKRDESADDEVVESTALPANQFYTGGDLVEYTGKTEVLHGGLFYEFKYLEGVKVGQIGVTQRAPDGSNPGQSGPQASTGIVTPQVPLPVKAQEPAMSPETAADRAYLQSLIDGTADMFAADVFDRLEPMFTAYENDAEMVTLLNAAAEAYSQAAVKAAQTALAA